MGPCFGPVLDSGGLLFHGPLLCVCILTLYMKGI